jgi:hypothetical protein
MCPKLLIRIFNNFHNKLVVAVVVVVGDEVEVEFEFEFVDSRILCDTYFRTVAF